MKEVVALLDEFSVVLIEHQHVGGLVNLEAEGLDNHEATTNLAHSFLKGFISEVYLPILRLILVFHEVPNVN